MARRTGSALSALVLLALIAGAAATGSSVHLVGSKGEKYVRAGEPAPLCQHGLAHALAAAVGLAPPRAAGADGSAAASAGEALVARDALSRPRAAVFLSLAGLKEQASHVATIFGDRLARRADVAAGTGRQSASPILGALEAVAKANPDVPVREMRSRRRRAAAIGPRAAGGPALRPPPPPPLPPPKRRLCTAAHPGPALTLRPLPPSHPSSSEQIAPLGGDAACGDACQEAALAALAPQIGAAYAPAAGGAPMAGALTLTPAVTFDLSRPADRAFAAELASLYAAASARNGAPSLADDVELMAGTLTALQGVADAYGADSAAYAAAADALVADLRVSVAQLDAAFGGDAVYALGFVPAGAGAEARAATRRLLGVRSRLLLPRPPLLLLLRPLPCR